ncbi:hypothetical protein WOLCODRAFT_156321 [Wolfiporia cocos MD-104 SS10]|uniref:Uncharacterized protein n=1 Tax=Wolfiporia cocos (strain MD-104) TaxID=742152 RepID=A0A2H3J058_WOLCO|nr:hypothetical protein WOLCODRAFT_156321 [Wolfiporia cocos MD-104 SS10]
MHPDSEVSDDLPPPLSVRPAMVSLAGAERRLWISPAGEWSADGPQGPSDRDRAARRCRVLPPRSSRRNPSDGKFRSVMTIDLIAWGAVVGAPRGTVQIRSHPQQLPACGFSFRPPRLQQTETSQREAHRRFVVFTTFLFYLSSVLSNLA